MARVKGGLGAKKRHNRTLKLAKLPLGTLYPQAYLAGTPILLNIITPAEAKCTQNPSFDVERKYSILSVPPDAGSSLLYL